MDVTSEGNINILQITHIATQFKSFFCLTSAAIHTLGNNLMKPNNVHTVINCTAQDHKPNSPLV